MPHLVSALDLAARHRSLGGHIRVSAKPPEKKVYEYTERQVSNRHRDKAERLQKFAPKISDLRATYRKDLKAKDPMKRLVSLAVGLIDHTYERVGNTDSADDAGHYGVVVWEVRHVKFKDGHADIRYTGKSGVKHVKTVDDAGLVAALKAATKGKDPTERVFCEGDDCVVSASDVNEYLEPYGITAKDIRGLGANDEVRDALRRARTKGPELPHARKEKDKILEAEFKRVLDEVAEIVGHEPATLRSHYLAPVIEKSYLHDGSVPEKLDKKATHTQSEKDDREDERLIRRSPKKKPPRTDLHRKRTRDSDTTSSDPDKDQDQKDRSQNYKDAGSRVARRYLAVRVLRRYASGESQRARFLKEQGKTKVKNPESGLDVSLSTLARKDKNENAKEYGVYEDAYQKWLSGQDDSSATPDADEAELDEAELDEAELDEAELDENANRPEKAEADKAKLEADKVKADALRKTTQGVLGQHEFRDSPSLRDVQDIVGRWTANETGMASREAFNNALTALSANVPQAVKAAAEDAATGEQILKDAEKAKAYFRVQKNSTDAADPELMAAHTAALMKAHVFTDPVVQYGIRDESRDPIVPAADRTQVSEEEKVMLERVKHKANAVFARAQLSKISDDDAKTQIKALTRSLDQLPEHSPAHRKAVASIHALKVYQASISGADSKQSGMSPVLTNAIRAAAKTGDVDWFLDTSREDAHSSAHAADIFSVKLREIYDKLSDKELLAFVPSEHPLKKLAEDTFESSSAPAARKFVRDEILTVMQAQQKFHTDDPEVASEMGQAADQVEGDVENAIGGDKNWFNVKKTRDSIKSSLAAFLARLAKLWASAKAKSQGVVMSGWLTLAPAKTVKTRSEPPDWQSKKGTRQTEGRWQSPPPGQQRFSSYKTAMLTAANAFPTPNEDFDMLTRQGARRVTSMLDRLASVIQENPAILGINRKIAQDFAYRCDLLSDAVEGRAVANFPRLAAEADEDDEVEETPKTASLRVRLARLRRLAAEAEAADEDDEVEETPKTASLRVRLARLRRLAGDDEDEDEDEVEIEIEEATKAAKKASLRLRLARLRRLAGEDEGEDEDEDDIPKAAKKATRRRAQFAPSDIGEEDSGPLEQIDDDAPFMDGHFTQSNFSELRKSRQTSKTAANLTYDEYVRDNAKLNKKYPNIKSPPLPKDKWEELMGVSGDNDKSKTARHNHHGFRLTSK